MNKGNIMRKLLRQPASNNENVDTNLSDSPQLRPSASQNTFYAAGAPIACLDRSPDGNHAVIAGTKVFKTVKVDGPTIVEDIDLRSIITSYATSHDISAASADRLSIKSVAWSHSDFDTTIFAACTNGRVTAYDLNKLGEGLEVVRIHDHTRQVHKLAIHPFRGHLLLSASQDGTVKLFDARNRIQGNNGGLILRTFQNYKCNADAVRDVKWSPRDGFEFACSTEAGVIQKWDSRKVTAPILKFVAHTKACVSIAWHPDGEHIVSGGMDQRCHVWDFSKKAERNQKPKYSFDTPAAVSSVSWRPACWSATAQGRRAAQVSVSYDDTNSNKAQNASVHIWDLARPGLPFKEIEQWDSAPTGLLWSTRDLLWSVDRDGHFKQTDVAFVPKLIDRRSLSTFSFSASGDVLMVLEERQTSRRPPPTLNPSDVTATYEKISPNGQQLSVSRSDSEEDVVGSFLGPRQRKSHGRRSNQAMANATPTSTPSKLEGRVMSLDDAVRVTGPYIPQQVMAIGHAPSTARPGLYQYLTNRYLIRLANTKSVPFSEQTPDIVLSSTMEHFANTAENVGHYRLAQTWRILGYTMNLVLTRRAQYHRESRLALPKAPLQQEETNGLKLRPDIDEETPRKLPPVKPPFDSSPINPAGRSIIAEEMESTSNVATPRVRPVRDSMVPETSEIRDPQLTGADYVENDILDLSPPSHSTPDPINMPGVDRSNEPKSSEEGYDFYGMDSFSPAINFHLPQKKQPLRLDYADHNGSPRRMPITRHDSGESFEMFSTSGDSHARFMSSSESDMAHSAGRETGRSLRDAVASWENSFNSSLRHHRPSIDSEVAPHVTTSSGAATPNSSNGGARHALPLKRASPPALLLHQASLQAVNKFEDSNTNNTIRPSIPDQTSDDPNLIESDYLPWPNDPEFVIAPIDPNALIQRTIQFEVQTGVLNASAIILSLGALLHPKALDSIQSAAILRQYHSRLQSLKLFSEAALLRNLCVPLYSTVWEDSQSNVNTGYFCTDCNKAIENDPLIPGSMWRCPRCRQTIDGCAVCRHREADTPYLDTTFDSEEKVDLQLWWYCLGCGHGGHTACMQAWHESPSSPSDGCCPLEGCLHSCLPGSWREQIETERRTLQEKALAKMIRESGPKGRSVGAQVRRDVREVNQSKAVEGVRVALALGGQGRQSSGPGGLERRRSVKVLAPGEER